MNRNTARYIETKITRLSREIAEIDGFFYRGSEDEDRGLYASMLERKRDDMVRSTVLQIHTAIENILLCVVVLGEHLTRSPFDSGYPRYARPTRFSESFDLSK